MCNEAGPTFVAPFTGWVRWYYRALRARRLNLSPYRPIPFRNGLSAPWAPEETGDRPHSGNAISHLIR